MESWHPESYRRFAPRQQPSYSETNRERAALDRVSSLPPIVFPGEIERLKQSLARAADGAGFVLQGGDCVERFADCTGSAITNKLKILLQMSVVLTYAARCPVVRIGRFAGQYFKPRSKPIERVDGVDLPAYRGDGINRIEPDPESRRHDPSRMVEAYFHAAATLNYVRAMIAGGFADLHHPESWNLHDMARAPRWTEYRDILDHITDAVSFMDSFGGAHRDTLGDIEFYTSHEALHLGYEAALTREASLESGCDGWYNLGAHMLWIGERTRNLDGGHVEYARGVANPVGVKIGPDADLNEIVEMLGRLSVDQEPGKIVVITRFGVDRVRRELPELIEVCEQTRIPLVYSCDPMHGNTRTTNAGLKTRHFDDVLEELDACFSIHARLGTRLAGVHFELTGEDVTECIGGGLGLNEDDLSRDYRTYCDPRMNYAQSMEMSFLISRYLRTS